MATYKVLQDIEAEDKILGPLTLRQFIYALITCFFLYLCFVVVTKHAAYLLIIFLPPALFTGFLAFPFGRDQPTEVWAVAKIGFLFQPRKRIWDQSGVKELVTVTVPKKVERIYTNGLSQTEVQSRLSALANTIDSRGWAIKNVNVNLYAQPALISDDYSDRLVAMSSMPQAVPDVNIQASDDMMDETSNPIAQQFTLLISEKEQAHRKQLIDNLNSGPVPASTDPKEPNWFLPQEAKVIEPATPYSPTMAEAAMPTAEDIALIEKIKAGNEASHQNYTSHLRNVIPLSEQKPVERHLPLVEKAVVPKPAEPAVPTQPDPYIQYLSRDNNQSIASLGRDARQSKLNDNPDEVVVSLR